MRFGCVVPWKVHLNAKEPYCKPVQLAINIPRWRLFMHVVYKALIGSITIRKQQLLILVYKKLEHLTCAFIISNILCSVELLWYDFLLCLILLHIYWFNVFYFVLVTWFSSFWNKEIRNQSGCFLSIEQQVAVKNSCLWFDSRLKSRALSHGQTHRDMRIYHSNNLH